MGSASPKKQGHHSEPTRVTSGLCPSLRVPADLRGLQALELPGLLCHIQEGAAGIWAPEQSFNPWLPPPASSHPHPDAGCVLAGCFPGAYVAFGKVSRVEDMLDGPNPHLTKSFLIGERCWWRRPGFFPIERSRAESKKRH